MEIIVKQTAEEMGKVAARVVAAIWNPKTQKSHLLIVR